MESNCPNCEAPLLEGQIECKACQSNEEVLSPGSETEEKVNIGAAQLADEHIRFVLQSKFNIIREIGRGGMAVVFEAIEPDLARKIAIKALPPELARDPNLVMRFKREAQVAAGLVHPHIIPIHSVGSIQNVHYFTMAYMKGGNLLGRLQNGPIDERTAVRIIKQLASALAYSHRKGVIHRDIKPGNIMFDEHETAVLGDFGIAKALLQPQLTNTKAFFGTPHYISPEQAMGRMIDGRTDLYSLGVLFYQMVSGQLPFSADDPLSVLFQQVNLEPPSLHHGDQRISQSLESVIFKLLQKDPTRRYANADFLEHDLGRLPIKKTDPEQQASKPPTSTPQKPSGKLTRHTTNLLYKVLGYFGLGPLGRGKEESVEPTQTIVRQPRANRRAMHSRFPGSWKQRGQVFMGIITLLIVSVFFLLGQWVFDNSLEMDSLDEKNLPKPVHIKPAPPTGKVQTESTSAEQEPNPKEVSNRLRSNKGAPNPLLEQESKSPSQVSSDSSPRVENYSKGIPIQDPQEVRWELVLSILAQMGFASIPSGEFRMGSWVFFRKDERPVHTVTVSEFNLGKKEVTQALWKAVMDENPSCHKGGDLPVENVSWLDVQNFLTTLTALDRHFEYRLPTEAEWEYACRSGTVGMYSGKAMGVNLVGIGWDRDNSDGQSHPVGEKGPNSWGLYDMHGNVWEWCSDWYDSDYYDHSGKTNPKGPKTGREKVIRGGAFNSRSRACRSANRYYQNPDISSCAIGFRLVRQAKNEMGKKAPGNSKAH